ncbi:MAG: hypothetical protein ACRDWN_08115, partial [Acidimicrobiales bacterium]
MRRRLGPTRTAHRHRLVQHRLAGVLHDEEMARGQEDEPGSGSFAGPASSISLHLDQVRLFERDDHA